MRDFEKADIYWLPILRDPRISNFQDVKLFSSYRMPGHIKKSTGPDPDPSPWLKVSDEFRDRNKNKPYDPKKSCWVPNANKVSGILPILPNVNF